ncbi:MULTISPECIES: response regulator [Streptomyces]|uniref:DNA-binding response regulator, NarL/FixJ family, contains REC and HTH domains n=1 Tax=Streptomyces misionensis TaxID=67331 RepID=A0A1H5B5L5_9ACTN|nr:MULTISPECIES: response regulator transcription factor [Streptomyces]SED49929.1 DNA-binding response regulator, NarL/FixJ family, contains REC and HTH domains [Streptomyces misionensis]SFY52621.1 Transcriptional regulatory protein DegU [Streptomyces sp. F-1]
MRRHVFPPPARLRLLVADDNPVVRAGLTALLADRADTTVVAEAVDGREAYEAALRHRPDVVLLDVRMPGVDGLAALPHLLRLAPVMMLTYSHDSRTVREALRLGAGGYLVHGEFTTEQLVRAVRDVHEGRPHVTPGAARALLDELRGSAPAHTEPQLPAIDVQNTLPPPSQLQSTMGQSSRSRFRLSVREAEIMDLIASGMTNQQIAAACFISEKTVKNHINRIFAKLQATTRSQAAAKWLGVA